MEKLNKLLYNGEEYLSKEVLLKWIREISDAVNSFSDRADPIRAQGANKVISLLLEKIEPPQEHWKPSEEQMKALNEIVNILAASPFFHQNDYLFNILNGLREELKKLL